MSSLCCTMLSQDGDKRTALHAAAYCGDTECVCALIQAGSKVSPKDSQWLSPLHHAAASGHESTVKELIKNHADPMARDKNWMTPLHMTALNNHIKCAGEWSCLLWWARWHWSKLVHSSDITRRVYGGKVPH